MFIVSSFFFHLSLFSFHASFPSSSCSPSSFLHSRPIFFGSSWVISILSFPLPGGRTSWGGKAAIVPREGDVTQHQAHASAGAEWSGRPPWGPLCGTQVNTGHQEIDEICAQGTDGSRTETWGHYWEVGAYISIYGLSFVYKSFIMNILVLLIYIKCIVLLQQILCIKVKTTLISHTHSSSYLLSLSTYFNLANYNIFNQIF